MEREMGCIPDQSPREDIPRPPPPPASPDLTCRVPKSGVGNQLPAQLQTLWPPAAAAAAAAAVLLPPPPRSIQLGAPGLGYNHPLLPGAHSRVVRCPAGP